MPSRFRWNLPQTGPGEAEALRGALGVCAPVARTLIQRGYRDAGDAARFLAPSLDELSAPLLMAGMREAVDRITAAIRGREPILLFGDYDVDGVVSVVILKTVIERAGGLVRCQVPNRLREGYGLSEEAVAEAAAGGVKLLVSADTGIRATEAVIRARSLGVDVIVTDHHLPDAQLPPALAVLNPRRPDCAYPEKNLCGAGVVFRLAEALLTALAWPAERRRRMLESFLKLVAIATVADVVPLTGENRILVKHGLAGLGDARNPGLRALLDVAGFAAGQAPTARQVAFQIAPRLNAAGRMADAGDAIELFLTGDPARAGEIALRLHSLNQQRQETEAGIVRQILEQCETRPVTPDQKALVFSSAGWHRGVLGIVASRVVERFYRPAIVLGEDPDTGMAQGSGRSIPPFHLLEALESMPELFHKFGGHRQAAGVSLASDLVAEFRERLNRHAASVLSEDDLVPALNIDAAVTLNELDDAAVEEVLSLEPFGFGNPAPVFAVWNAEIAAAPVVMKEKHLRIHVREGGRTMTAKAWNFSARREEFPPGGKVDLAVTLERDNFAAARGLAAWSATVRDVRAACSR